MNTLPSTAVHNPTSIDTAQRWAAAATAALLISAASGMALAASEDKMVLPHPVDLATEAALAGGRGQPLVLLFSLPDCPYCKVIRRNYLLPLAREGRAGAPMLVREVEITGKGEFPGFARERSSGVLLAQHYKIRVAPTVLLLDAAGRLLAKPLVGGDVAGMYGAFLDGALDEAEAKLAPSGGKP